jgi:hypothetical protein
MQQIPFFYQKNWLHKKIGVFGGVFQISFFYLFYPKKWYSKNAVNMADHSSGRVHI